MHAGGVKEDACQIRSMGFDVDDDNEAAPESIPDPESERASKLSQERGWEGFCNRKKTGMQSLFPSIKNQTNDGIRGFSKLDALLLLFPLVDRAIERANSNSRKEKKKMLAKESLCDSLACGYS